MAEDREKLINLLSLAFRAGDFLLTEDQDLEVLSALHTMIFKDRHVNPPCRILIY